MTTLWQWGRRPRGKRAEQTPPSGHAASPSDRGRAAGAAAARPFGVWAPVEESKTAVQLQLVAGPAAEATARPRDRFAQGSPPRAESAQSGRRAVPEGPEPAATESLGSHSERAQSGVRARGGAGPELPSRTASLGSRFGAGSVESPRSDSARGAQPPAPPSTASLGTVPGAVASTPSTPELGAPAAPRSTAKLGSAPGALVSAPVRTAVAGPDSSTVSVGSPSGNAEPPPPSARPGGARRGLGSAAVRAGAELGSAAVHAGAVPEASASTENLGGAGGSAPASAAGGGRPPAASRPSQAAPAGPRGAASRGGALRPGKLRQLPDGPRTAPPGGTGLPSSPARAARVRPAAAAAPPAVSKPRPARARTPRAAAQALPAAALVARAPARSASDGHAPGAVRAPRRAPTLFRTGALAAREVESPATQTFSPPTGSSWGTLFGLLSLVVLLFGGAALLSVDVTAEAAGTLRAPSGLRPVASALGGSVTKVVARPGQRVEAGEVVAVLEGAELQAALVRRERELSSVEKDVEAARQADDQMAAEARRALSRRRSALQDRLSIAARQLEQRRAHARGVAELVLQGASSAADALSVQEAASRAEVQLAALRAEAAQLDLETADRDRQWKQREAERRLRLESARGAVEEARALLQRVELRAPSAGRLESLLVQPGAVVTPGQVLAQIVPEGAPRSIVAFVSARESSFVRVGAEAQVEIESLPTSEFGVAHARVARVSAEAAAAGELAAALGAVPSGRFVRVELDLLDAGREGIMQPHLRSGARVLVRLHRRQRRILAVLFDFVRELIEPRAS